MNVLNPISSIMTKDVITVSPTDRLLSVKEVFDTHRIHHLPVVEDNKIVGIISKTDLLHFIKGMAKGIHDELINKSRLQETFAREIMTTGLAKIEADERIMIALEVFKENLFHAILVVKDDNELVGILTTYDIIAALANEKIKN